MDSIPIAIIQRDLERINQSIILLYSQGLPIGLRGVGYLAPTHASLLYSRHISAYNNENALRELSREREPCQRSDK